MKTLTIHLSIENLTIDPSTGTIVININGNQLDEPQKAKTRLTSTNTKSGRMSRFTVLMEELIDQMLRKDKKRSAEAYQSALNSFMTFRKQEDIYFYEIKSSLTIRTFHLAASKRFLVSSTEELDKGPSKVQSLQS